MVQRTNLVPIPRIVTSTPGSKPLTPETLQLHRRRLTPERRKNLNQADTEEFQGAWSKHKDPQVLGLV